MLCTERQKSTSLMKNNINNIQATTNKIEFNGTNERVSERAKKRHQHKKHKQIHNLMLQN